MLTLWSRYPVEPLYPQTAVGLVILPLAAIEFSRITGKIPFSQKDNNEVNWCLGAEVRKSGRKLGAAGLCRSSLVLTRPCNGRCR